MYYGLYKCLVIGGIKSNGFPRVQAALPLTAGGSRRIITGKFPETGGPPF